MKKLFSPIIIASALWLLTTNTPDNSAFSQPATERSTKPACSNQNLETLTSQLLRDLPSYANRASQRARRLKRRGDAYSYVLFAGKPEFQPLPLNPVGDVTDEQKKLAAQVEQVFFTTLERQYTSNKAIELQEFHWLLLTKTPNGWALVMMFTQTGSADNKQPPTPPRDSSNGKIAQGVKTWLRDCQAGSISRLGSHLRGRVSRLEEAVRCGEPLAVDGFPGISKVVNPEGGSLRCSNCRQSGVESAQEILATKL